MMKKLFVVLICLGLCICILGLSTEYLTYYNLKSSVESIGTSTDFLKKDLLSIGLVVYSLDATFLNVGADTDLDIWYSEQEQYYYLTVSYDPLFNDDIVNKSQDFRLTQDYDSSESLVEQASFPCEAIYFIGDFITFGDIITKPDEDVEFLDYLKLFLDLFVLISSVILIPLVFLWVIVFFLVDTVLLLFTVLFAFTRFIGLL